MSAPIFLYDGVCVLCSAAVRYVLKHELRPEMRFVAIQSLEGRALAKLHHIDPDDPATFLFLENGMVHEKSDGVLTLLKHVGGPARALRMGRIFPKALRDALYVLIARNRFKLFGKLNSCRLPDAVQRHRFVMPEA
jgi:predicted DCC family thiol-disulfide oxidoreductase YuxK